MHRHRHTIAKITLRSTNFDRTQRFYAELFGWEFQQYSPTYLGFEPPSGIDGGFQKVASFTPGDSVVLYILVDEFESYLRRLPGLQGSSKEEVEVVPGYGEYVRFYDPDGNRLALWRTTEATKKTQSALLNSAIPALIMKILYKVSTLLILALGLLHISLTPVLFRGFTSAALWFVSGGMVIIFLSFFNLILMSDAGKQRIVRNLTHIANVIGLVFGCAMLIIESRRTSPGPVSWLVLALLVFETVAAFRYASRRSF